MPRPQRKPVRTETAPTPLAVGQVWKTMKNGEKAAKVLGLEDRIAFLQITEIANGKTSERKERVPASTFGPGTFWVLQDG